MKPLAVSGPRRGKTLLVGIAAAAAVLAIAGATICAARGVLSSGAPDPAAHRSTGDNSSCIIDRVPKRYAWLNGNRAQRGAEAVWNRLRSDYGASDMLTGLRMGLIGVAVDDADKRLVVVVDPGVVDRRELQGRLTAAAGNGLAVTVAAGCHPALDLVEARQTVFTETSHVNVGLSPYDSKWHVRLSPADRELGERLVSRADGLVAVEYVRNPGGVRF